MKRVVFRLLLLAVLLVLAVFLGNAAAQGCEGIPFLSWLAWRIQFGWDPVTLDLYVMQLEFGAHVAISVAETVLVLGAVLLGSQIKINV